MVYTVFSPKSRGYAVTMVPYKFPVASAGAVCSRCSGVLRRPNRLGLDIAGGLLQILEQKIYFSKGSFKPSASQSLTCHVPVLTGYCVSLQA